MIHISQITSLFIPQPAFAADNTYIGKVNAGPGFAISLGSVITTAISVVMGIGAILTFLYLIWGGIEWITSGGEKSKAEQARTKITTAVIGLIVLAASYALLKLVLEVLGFSSLSNALNGIKRIK